jgi:hypothetical protein
MVENITDFKASIEAVRNIGSTCPFYSGFAVLRYADLHYPFRYV